MGGASALGRRTTCGAYVVLLLVTKFEGRRTKRILLAGIGFCGTDSGSAVDYRYWGGGGSVAYGVGIAMIPH